MKHHIKSTIETLESEGITDFQAGWECLKYEERKFSIEYPKLLAQNKVESKLKKLETTTKFIENLDYIDCRNELDKINEKKVSGIRIRSKNVRCEYGEKSSKFFLNLEKSRAAQSPIRNVTKDEKSLIRHKRINHVPKYEIM